VPQLARIVRPPFVRFTHHMHEPSIAGVRHDPTRTADQSFELFAPPEGLSRPEGLLNRLYALVIHPSVRLVSVRLGRLIRRAPECFPQVRPSTKSILARVSSLHLDTLAGIKSRLDRFVAQRNLAGQTVLHILLSQILPDVGEHVDTEDMRTDLMEVAR